jgi:hypothetical protein
MRLRMTTMSALSRETLELISSWSEVLGAVFGILAATSVVVYVLVNRPLRKIEAHESQVERQHTADAQERAAKAELALKLYIDSVKKTAERQGPRQNLLDERARHELAEALRSFAGQKIDIRYGLNPYQDRASAEPVSADALELARAFIGILKDAQWEPTPVPLRDAMQGDGISVEINRKASPVTVEAANALVKAIGDVPLTVSAPLKFPDALEQRMETPRIWEKGKEIFLSPLDEDTIILVVLAHPA